MYLLLNLESRCYLIILYYYKIVDTLIIFTNYEILINKSLLIIANK